MSEPTLRPQVVVTTVSGPGGSIYDLGYQGYDGPRLGRTSATAALFRASLRAAFGLGRSGRAKIAPFTLAALGILPAILAVGIAALAAQAGAGDILEEASPVRYDSYHGLTVTLLMLFCAAQAPEIFGRDQRYGILPLYFSRVLTRSDYAIARLLGLMAALLVVDLVPQVILFVGRVLVAADPLTGLADEIGAVPRFVLQSLLTAGLLGGISGLIAAWMPRRAYATATIVAVFIIPPVLLSLVSSLTSREIARFAVFLSPIDVLDGANAWIFGATSQNESIARLDLPGVAFVVAAVVGAAGAILLTIRRFLRITA